jgi:hypothetical protein
MAIGSTIRDKIAKLAPAVLGAAIRRTRGAVYVNVEKLAAHGLPGAKLAEQLPRQTNLPIWSQVNWTVRSVDELAEQPHLYLPSSGDKGLIVTGYSDQILAGAVQQVDSHSSLILDHPGWEKEATVQGVIRELHQRLSPYTSADPRYYTLILADSLPAKSAFHSSLPWYNGPFEDDSFYSLGSYSQLRDNVQAEGLYLAQHKKTLLSGSELEWKNFSFISFPFEDSIRPPR